MSVSTARRRPLALNVSGVGIVQPTRQPRPHNFSLRLSRSEFEAMLDLICGIQRVTGRRVSQQAIVRSAVAEYLRRHRDWIATRPDQEQAAD